MNSVEIKTVVFIFIARLHFCGGAIYSKIPIWLLKAGSSAVSMHSQAVLMALRIL